MKELISCCCGGAVGTAPRCPIHGAGALARRNELFYYYASMPWCREKAGSSNSNQYRWNRLVDLVGVSLRISYTQAVYIATYAEATEYEKSFGPREQSCSCKESVVRLSGGEILYGTTSNGVSVSEVFEAFAKEGPRNVPVRTRHDLRMPDELRLSSIDWGDIDYEEKRYEPRLWQMTFDGVPVFRVYHVTPFMMETALIVLADEAAWAHRLEVYRDARRKRNGIEVMRVECGLTAQGERA